MKLKRGGFRDEPSPDYEDMKRLLEETMKRSTLIITLLTLILLWGGMSAIQIQRDYLPQINNPVLNLTVRAEHYQANQIKEQITKPIQQAVRVVDGLQDVETNTFNGGSFISLNFPMNYDMNRAEEQVSKALEGITMPEGVQKPLVTRTSTSSQPIMRMSVTSSSDNITENTLRTAVQEDIVNELKTVPGVKDVRVSGGGSAGYAVSLRMDDLKKSGLTVEDVKRSLEENDTTGMDGNISNSQISIPVQVSGWGIKQQDLLAFPIHAHDGKTVPLSAIADISNAVVNLQTISRTNGKPSVVLDILKTPSSNITDVADKIKSRVKDIPEIKNKDAQLSILFDQGELVHSSLNGLMKEGLLGCLFSMICVFLFFRKVRSTLLIALSLPICLLATIGVLKTIGISLNILTVSGLIVAMGRVVDDSIVILDNMNRSVHESQGKNSIYLLAQAVSEMIPAIVSSTATTIAVYVPIALGGGMVSSTFSGFAWSVVIALAVSLFVSILVVPVLYRLFWNGKPVASKDYLEPFAHRLFKGAFRRKKQMAIIFLVLFAAAAAGSAFLPVNFLPRTNSAGQIGVQVEMPQSTSLTEVDAEVKRLEELIRTNPKVVSFSSSLGSSFTPQSDDVFDAGGGWIQKPNIANVSINVKQGSDVDALMRQFQKQFNALSSKAIYTVTNLNIAGDDSQLKINLTGADNQTLEHTALTIRNQLKLVSGLAVQDTADDQDRTGQYQINLNRGAIEKNGLRIEDILHRIQQYTAEGTTGFMSINQNQIPIVIRSDLQNQFAKEQNGTALSSNDAAQQILSVLGGESFQNNKGQQVRLDQLATVTVNDESSVIQEKAGHPYAVVTANIISNDTEKVTKQVQSTLDNMPLPAGVKYSFAGAPQQMYEMIYEMAIALLFSVLLVLFIISAVFRGWKAPLSILICIPFAFIGSVVGMFMFDMEWNLAAFVGLMMLTGIVVTNGIVLVDKIERNLASGMRVEEAVLQGTLSRVRPILTTALTTILTVLPLTLSSGTDTVISQTLGVVVAGGMITSTCMSLFMIPIGYTWLHKQRTLSSRYTEEEQIAVLVQK